MGAANRPARFGPLLEDVGATLGAWTERERHRFVLLAPVLMIAGVASYLSLRVEPPLLLGPCVALTSLLGWGLASRRDRMSLRLVARAAFFASLGFALIQMRTHALAAPVIRHETPPVTVEGVLERVERREQGLRYTLRVERVGGFRDADTPHRVRISWRGRPTGAAPGDTVRLRAVLSPPPGPALPGGYDYALALWFERIGGVGYSYTGARVLRRAEGLRPGARLERLREAVADRIEARAGERAGGLAAALVTGKRERVPEAVTQRLRDTGLAHLLAISGLHMGLVCGFLFAGLRFVLAHWERAALLWPIKKIAAGAAIGGGAVYLALSGAPISAQRAFVMAAVAFGAVLFDRRAVSLRNVALAALLILCLRPEAAASAGFQMSFMAVTVLVAAFSWAESRRRRGEAGAGSRPLRFLGGLFATSALAGAATAPFAVYHFGRIAVWGLPANLAVMPVVTLLVMPTAVMGLLLMPIGLDGPLWWLMGRGLELVLAGAGWFEDLPGAVRLVAQPPAAAWLLVIGGMLTLCLFAAPWRLAGLLAFPLAAIAAQNAQRPDVFIGRDARQVAVRVEVDGEDRLSLLSRRRDRFSVETWLGHLGLPAVIADQPRFGECGEDACSVAMPNGGTLSVAETPAAAASACRSAQLVVYTGYAPAALGGCSALLFTAEALEDAAPVTLTGDVVRISAAARGCRPWAGCARP
ncbi:ComEC/Rec2 family competence protein [Parvularcula dongshanensis]|uniref:Competence protein ComEC n=1 Tax=Parvularcula dongshanensis TaxID=1173995 RepID=A0A840I0J0_9PROT|nr:ComEC/Rec2 family competence protein [Parvularcula dongshanensis]MBB4657698.1 competence protein ComEC [Parvularcula dongshanensis]